MNGSTYNQDGTCRCADKNTAGINCQFSRTETCQGIGTPTSTGTCIMDTRVDSKTYCSKGDPDNGDGSNNGAINRPACPTNPDSKHWTDYVLTSTEIEYLGDKCPHYYENQKDDFGGNEYVDMGPNGPTYTRVCTQTGKLI